MESDITREAYLGADGSSIHGIYMCADCCSAGAPSLHPTAGCPLPEEAPVGNCWSLPSLSSPDCADEFCLLRTSQLGVGMQCILHLLSSLGVLSEKTEERQVQALLLGGTGIHGGNSTPSFNYLSRACLAGHSHRASAGSRRPRSCSLQRIQACCREGAWPRRVTRAPLCPSHRPLSGHGPGEAAQDG